MRTVNECSQKLTGLVQAKASTSTAHKETSPDDLAQTARACLRTLRKAGEGDLDIERAASSITGKLIVLDMVSRSMCYHSQVPDHQLLTGISFRSTLKRLSFSAKCSRLCSVRRNRNDRTSAFPPILLAVKPFYQAQKTFMLTWTRPNLQLSPHISNIPP